MITYLSNECKPDSMLRLTDVLAHIKDLLRNHPQGMSVTEIASALGRNKHSTGRYLDILHAAGHVDLRTFGMAKVFTLSSRVPLSALLSYTTDLVLVLDRDMRIIQGNEPFFEMVGMLGKEILQKRIDQITTHNDDTKTFLAELMDAVSNKKETFEVTRNGVHRRSFRGKIIPTVFDDGSSADTIILEDVTLEREAVHSLKESEEFFRTVSDHLSDGLIVSEFENGKRKVIFHNLRLCEITGYSQNEINLINPEDLALPEEKKRFLKAVSEAEHDPGSMKEIRFWAERKDGMPIFLSIRVKLVPYGNNVRGYILITDMTRWKKQEEAQLLQATLIERLMTNFAHPLFIIGTDGIFFTANPAFCDLLHASQEEVVGKHANEVMPEKIAREFLKGNDELVKNSPNIHTHDLIPFFRQGGEMGDVIIEKSSVSAGENAPTYIFGIVMPDDTFFPDIQKRSK